MSQDKIICNKSDLTSVADTIRSKLGVTDTYYVSELSDAIERIPTGTQLPTLTNPGTSSDLSSGKELIDQKGSIITGTNPYEKSSTDAAIAKEATLISQIQTVLNDKASANIELPTLTNPGTSADLLSGKELIDQNGNKVTGTIPTKSATIITPSTSDQTINSGVYLTGVQTIKGDANLVAGNIKSGVSIFGVTGTASGGGSSGSLEQCNVYFDPFANLFSAPETPLVATTLSIDGISNNFYDLINGGLTVLGGVVKNSLIIIGATVNPTGYVCSGCEYVGSMGFTETGASRTVPVFKITEESASISGVPCFVKDTKITLSDRSYKLVQDISYDDQLLVWDFDNGCYSYAKPVWIKKKQTIQNYFTCKFENGVILKLVGSNGNCHRVFNLDDNCFEYATKCVGKTIMTENGPTKLLSCERAEEEVEFYNIITRYHINLFANSVLTSCRLNNLYKIKDMKFLKDSRKIIPIEAYKGISQEFYDGLRLGEQKLENIPEIERYVRNLINLRKGEK